MIVQYTELPRSVGGGPRPLLDLAVADVDDVRVPCLVDSGSQHTLLPRWVADVAAIDLTGTDTRTLGVAGSPTVASFVTAYMAVGKQGWEAEVGFCDPWPYAWGLLGQASFFRFFTVTFRAVDFTFEVEPIEE